LGINPVGLRARAAALGLGCFGFVTLALAIFSGVAIMYAFLPGRRFPFDALVGLALPVVLIGLGIWTFRRRSVGTLPSVIAIGVGIGALVIIAIFVLAGVIGRFY
jgi:hypothetical protein